MCWNYIQSIFVVVLKSIINNRKGIKAMTTWKIDPTHSEINFKVKHLVVSTVTGHFSKFDATIETSKEDFSDAKINF